MYEPFTPLTPPGTPRQPRDPSTADRPPVWTPVVPVASTEPVSPGLASTAPAASPARRTVGPRFVLGAVLASALLASGGTYVAISASDNATPANSVTGTAQTPAANNASSGSVSGGQASVVDIVKAVSPAVVTIVVEGVSATDPISGRTGVGSGTGSGVIFDANGLILTNRHVVAGDPQKLTVNLKDGRSFDGTIYGVDTLTDLAIVKVDATGLPTAPIGDSSAIEVGQQAIAIGSPLGTFTDSVTSGIISAIGRSIPVEDGTVLTNLIQTDTAINPGNSGGPLLDPTGKVIGINTAGTTEAQGIGFAIPIDIAKPLLSQATAGQVLSRPWMGIHFETIDAALRQANDLPVDNGAWIPSGTQSGDVIATGSPADKAGLQAGDIITAVDGTALDATHPLDLVMSQAAPGQTVRLDVLRDGQPTTITIVLGTRPATL